MSALRRPARLHLAWLTFLASAVVLALLATLLVSRIPWIDSSPRPLLVYCAAGLKPPVEAIAREYEEAYGVEIQLQYGGSNTLLAALQVSGRGDLYLPADGAYVESAREKGLIREVIPLAHMKPVLAVRRGNPKKVRSFDDLLERNLRISQANPEAAAIGRLSREVLVKKGVWKQFQRLVVVTKPTVSDVANDIQVGAADAGIVWDVTVRQVEGIESVPAPVLDGVFATLSVCVAEKTTQPSEALRFAHYLGGRDQGLPIFAREGFSPLDGSPSGAKNR
jgi:molybdate transport system substrate-binding protein